MSGFEFLHSAGGVYDFLVAGEKRMAGAANFHMGGFCGRAGFYLVSAGAGDDRFGIILGMYFFFHNIIYNIKPQFLQCVIRTIAFKVLSPIKSIEILGDSKVFIINKKIKTFWKS